MIRTLYIMLLASGCGVVTPAEEGSGSSSMGGTTTTSGTTGSSAGVPTEGGSSEDSGEALAGMLSDGEAFLPPTDLSGYPECSTYLQNCPAGQRCVPVASDGGDSWNDAKCVPVVPDPKQLGEPCVSADGGLSGSDDCDVGLLCWKLDAGDLGTCVALCGGSIEELLCPEGTVCHITAERVEILCHNGCDPLIQDCQFADEICISLPEEEGFECASNVSGEGGQVHDPCMFFQNVCQPGLACVDAASAVECDQEMSSCCEPYCDLQAANMCPGLGQECVPFFAMGMAPMGYENVGYCRVPE